LHIGRAHLLTPVQTTAVDLRLGPVRSFCKWHSTSSSRRSATSESRGTSMQGQLWPSVARLLPFYASRRTRRTASWRALKVEHTDALRQIRILALTLSSINRRIALDVLDERGEAVRLTQVPHRSSFRHLRAFETWMGRFGHCQAPKLGGRLP